MRLLADENIPESVVRAMREAGNDVEWARDTMFAQDDEKILARAQATSRIVLTQDKGFGDLAFKQHLPAQAGIILVRGYEDFLALSPERIMDLLRSDKPWVGNMTVITPNGTRVTALPFE